MKAQLIFSWGFALALTTATTFAADPTGATNSPAATDPSILAQASKTSELTASDTSLKAPAKVAKSVADVVKLSKAGLDERVIETYLDQTGSTYTPNADEIIYLREQGVSQAVIALMLRRGGSLRNLAVYQATEQDRLRDAMLDARQRSMFNREYPPYEAPYSRGYSYDAGYSPFAYGYSFGPPIVGYASHPYPARHSKSAKPRVVVIGSR